MGGGSYDLSISFRLSRAIAQGAQRGTDPVMQASEAEGARFIHGIFGGPLGNALVGDSHSSAIVARTAVDKNFLVRIFPHQF